MIRTIEKYGAGWCNPCKALQKTLSSLNTIELGINIVEYDAEEDNELFEKESIRNVPTLIFRDENNAEVARITGNVPSSRIMDTIKQFMQ